MGCSTGLEQAWFVYLSILMSIVSAPFTRGKSCTGSVAWVLDSRWSLYGTRARDAIAPTRLCRTGRPAPAVRAGVRDTRINSWAHIGCILELYLLLFICITRNRVTKRFTTAPSTAQVLTRVRRSGRATTFDQRAFLIHLSRIIILLYTIYIVFLEYNYNVEGSSLRRVLPLPVSHDCRRPLAHS